MKQNSSLQHRLAQLQDVPSIRLLMDASIRQLLSPHLTSEQLQASFGIMGVDTQLIEDQTYFVVESEGQIAGCGGWSRRATLFGGDNTPGRNAALLNPLTDAARVRAMYTHPNFARRGVARMILELCENAAAAERFLSVELASTTGGVSTYAACGYQEIERFFSPTPMGVPVPLIKMGKPLIPSLLGKQAVSSTRSVQG